MFRKGTFVDTKQHKPWYVSKTVWVNLLVFALSLLAAVSGEAWVNFEYVTIATAVVNVLLRFITSDPIGWFKE